MRGKIKYVVGGLTLLFLITVGYYLIPLPEVDKDTADYAGSFCVSGISRFEHNPPNQCAGFATAYVLRSNGIEADGENVYKDLSYKIPVSGYVVPKGIAGYLGSKGINAHIYTGKLSDLKSRLNQGKPIIVLIGRHIKWQHYMVLLGYSNDEKDLYFYDSKQAEDGNKSYPGNRTIKEDYFLELWDNNLPLFEQLYIVTGDF